MRACRWLIVAVVSAGLLMAACSSNDSSSAPASGGGASTGGGGGATASLGVKDFQFDPTTVTVASGETTITVTNTGSAEHSFTMDDGSASVDVPPGESKTVVLNIAADATFHCKYHSQMTGTLKVS